MINKIIFTSFVLLATSYSLSWAQVNMEKSYLSDICYDCICEFILGCNSTGNCNSTFCNYFKISFNEWIYGGKIKDSYSNNTNDMEDYKACVNSMLCSRQTLMNFMYMWGQDCSGNGRVDCYDLAGYLHFGWNNCMAYSSNKYFRVLDDCFNKFRIINFLPLLPLHDDDKVNYANKIHYD